MKKLRLESPLDGLTSHVEVSPEADGCMVEVQQGGEYQFLFIDKKQALELSAWLDEAAK